MATINNIEKICKLLVSTFGDILDPSDAFFNIQLIQRKKDVPECNGNSRLIKSINIPFKNKLEELLKQFEYIRPTLLKLCQNESCRAMINLNPCSKKTMNLRLIQKITDNMIQDQLDQLVFNNKGMLQSVIDNSHHTGSPKLWVLDVDTKDISQLETIKQFLMENTSKLNFKISLNDTLLLETLETKNGFHLITRPFNVQLFNEVFPEIEIKNHGLTNLIIL